MSSPTTLISRTVPTLVTVNQECDAIPTKLSFDSTDPFAVTLTSLSAHGEVEWVFARELLRDGLTEQTGEGDIKVHSEFGAVVLELTSPTGRARLECARHSVELFVDDIYATVPDGLERQSESLDTWLTELVSN